MLTLFGTTNNYKNLFICTFNAILIKILEDMHVYVCLYENVADPKIYTEMEWAENSQYNLMILSWRIYTYISTQ